MPLAAYRASLARRPFLTQALTAGVLFTVGDAVAQRQNDSTAAHDWPRTARMAAYGTLVAGPTTFAWFRALERHIRFRSPAAEVVARVAVDQAVFAPSFLAVFISFQAAVSAAQGDGDVIGTMKQRLGRDYFDVLRMNYFVWPWVQLVNFYCVPLAYRLAVVNLVAIGWNAYLSRVTSASIDETSRNK